MLGWVLLISIISGIGGTGLGGVLGAVLRRDSEKTVSLLLSFAAGIMLGISLFDLVPESVESAGVWICIVGVLAGYLIVLLLNRIIDRSTDPEVPHIDSEHPKTADDLGELIHAKHLQVHQQAGQKSELFVAGIIMACAIALHNIPEGMVIGASYAANAQSASGLAMAIVIGLHDIPEGMAVAVPLISGGMNRVKAAVLTALTGVPTVLGAVLGYFLGTLSPLALALSLSFACGAMLYVSFGELIPESILMWRSKLPAFAVLIGILTGLIIVMA